MSKRSARQYARGMAIRAAIYARISDDKAGEGLGVQRQKDDCKALAAREDYYVHGVYVDNDFSAYSGKKKRPGYHDVIAAIEEGSVDMVVTWDLDRLHRNTMEAQQFFLVCKRHSVDIHTVTSGKLNILTSGGMLHVGLLGEIARYESAHKAERIQRAQEQKAMKGEWLGGSRPFGWQLVGGAPMLDEQEAAIVREAHAHVLAGYSLGSFIEALRDRGIPTARGGDWSYATLRQMLLRPRNAGLAAWHGDIVGPSVFPPIIERHVWEATRAVLTDPARRRSRSNKVKHLLAGIAVCECLRPVKSGQIRDRKGIAHMIYRCSKSGPGHVSKRMSYVDEHVERQILLFLGRDSDGSKSAPADPATLDRLRTDEMAHRERLNDAARLYADEVIDREQLAEMSKRIRADMTAVQQQLADLEEVAARREQVEMPEIDWTQKASREYWDSLHIERKRAWIRASMEVVLHRHWRGSARVFDTSTVQVIVKSADGSGASADTVAQWKREHPMGRVAVDYEIMIQEGQATTSLPRRGTPSN